MRRAPIVIAATVVGLLGVLEFHPKSSSLSLGSLPAAGAAATSAATAPAQGSSASAGPPPLAAPPPASSAKHPSRYPAVRHADGRRASDQLQLRRAVGYRHRLWEQDHQGRDRLHRRLRESTLAVHRRGFRPAA